MIELREVSAIYPNGTLALANISCRIEKGEFVFLVGPTGHGKSSLLKLLFHELPSSRGDVIVGGENLRKLSGNQIAHLRRRMGIVFQDFRLLSNRTLWENVAFALRVTGQSRANIHRTVPELLCRVGLSHRAEAFPAQVSAGEQQRAAIARALASSPALLLADEPTGNLDPDTGQEIMNLLAEINQAGATVVCATHNQQLVDAMRRRVIIMQNGQIVSDQPSGSYQQLLSPPPDPLKPQFDLPEAHS
jgi:cell division transport system ATP-binding protein